MNIYATSLKALAGNNEEFDALIQTLAADKTVKTADMRAIAKEVLGYEIKKSKGRAAALKVIVDDQALNARQTARMANIEAHMKSW